jgi:alkyldihydroxyacetonephosphate synthase
VKARFEPTVDVDETLVSRLRDACSTVTVDEASRIEAGRDWWPLAMVWARAGEVAALPTVVATPSSSAEVAAVLRICNEARIPVTPAAGRSGVCGASVPVFGGVVLDLTGLSGITDVDQGSLVLDVRAGTWGHELERSLRADHGATLGHWPQSIELSTVGGWVACRSAGQYSTRYGKIEDMVLGLRVVLADGTSIHTGVRAPRAAMGPDLQALFVGSEGTLGVITDATLRLHVEPAEERRAAYSFPSFADGLEACRRILRRGATPAVLRLYDERESRRSFDVSSGNVLIVLDEGDPLLIDGVMTVIDDECSRLAATAQDGALVERWLGHRNNVGGLAEAIDRDIVVDTCEVAASWTALPGLYERGLAAIKAVDGAWVASAHQSHAYPDGACLYFTFAGQREGDPDGLYADAWNAIMQATLESGGAISHHHGIGVNRARFMRDALGEGAFDALVAVKRSLDPNGVLNPGKLGLPSPFGPEVPWP